MTDIKTHTMDVPGAVLTYDVRGADAASTAPPLLLIGSPMAAAGFGTLAGHFADRVVITYDPRGSERSVKADPLSQTQVEEHADDLHRIIAAVSPDAPVDIFANSGGAVNALALVSKHPEQVHTLIAHEPPATAQLPDRDAALAVCRDIRDTYMKEGFGPAMAKFIGLVSFQGPITEEYLARPAPDPAMFGLPTEDDGSREEPLLGQNMITCNAYEHDLDAVRAAATTVVVGIGEDSGDILPARAAIVVAEKIGTTPVMFPGDHGGFLGGEYGQTGKPAEFGAKVREVLGAA
jgi:pimeloyl-ACP methyl ester carboxylesterase